MRILFLDQFADLGGAQRCLLDLLPCAGWEAHAALPGDGPLARRLEERGVAVHRISLHNYSAGVKNVWDGALFLRDLAVVPGEIRTLVNQLDISVVYVNGPRLMPAVARARLGRPVIFHAHNPVSAANGAALVRAAVGKNRATVIAASRSLGMPGRVIYSGVEGPAAHTRCLLDRPRIGLIGRISPQKRQKEFVLAAAALQTAEFVLCGDVLFGDPRYKAEVLSLAPPSLQYLGWRDDVYDVLSNLDMLVVPSSDEGGVPRVILEAFAAGVPVLALASGAIPEVVKEGENGFLLHTSTPEEIAGRIQELLARPDLLTAVAERAHRLWFQRFTVERYRAEVWEVVEASSRRKTAAAMSPAAETDTSATG